MQFQTRYRVTFSSRAPDGGTGEIKIMEVVTEDGPVDALQTARIDLAEDLMRRFAEVKIEVVRSEVAHG